MAQENEEKKAALEKMKTDQYFESQKRAPYYTSLLEDIVNANKGMHSLKKWFLGAALGVLFIITSGVIAVLIILACKEKTSTNDIVIAASGFGSLLSTVIIIPKIMAKHIFPEDSEKERFKFVNNMRKVDQIELPDPPKEFNESNKDYLIDLNVIKKMQCSKKQNRHSQTME